MSLCQDVEIVGDGYCQIAYGSVANISCKIPEDSTAVRLSWLKGYETVRSEAEVALSSVQVRSNGNIFNGATGADGGEDTCLASALNSNSSDVGNKSVNCK